MKTAWIDARHSMANQRLWGLTLLERNLRELAKLGVTRVTVLAKEDLEAEKHFCHALPKSLEISWIFDDSDSFASLVQELENSKDLVLALDGHALNDRRILTKLLAMKTPCAAISPNGNNPAGVALLSSSVKSVFRDEPGYSLTRILEEALKESRITSFDFSTIDAHIVSLRRTIPPFLLLLDETTRLKEADELLRQTAHKGVLEFVAKHIHPPLEFGMTRLIAHTRITPNQITVLWLILAGATIPLFATGKILIGTILAAVSGVLDGVDGKLARLTLRFSKTGDLLDHVGGTLYDPIWYLALGWYFASGDFNSTAAQITYLLCGSYIVQRIVPGIFKKLHGSEIYDYTKIDIFARLIGSRMNNNIWLMLIGAILGLARETFYFISVWMFATALWNTGRLLYVTLKGGVSKPVLSS